MRKYRQTGVAVVTALLLTTLAITIVASLFWQQQVQVRSIENQRFQLQKKWILRGALDWARLILREDVRNQRDKVDHLGEPWAVNLGETQLDQYVENGKSDSDSSEATVSGKISDAQARFNLTNLALNGVPDPREVAVLARLLTNLRLEAALAKNVAAMIASTQGKMAIVEGQSGTASGSTPANPAGDVGPSSAGGTGQPGASSISVSAEVLPEVQFLRFSQIDDLLAVTGVTPEALFRLKDFVTVLPSKTKINLNTTSAEVLAARLNIGITDAGLMISSRDRAYFLDLSDFKQRFPDKIAKMKDEDVDVGTNYFFVNGKVRLSRSALEVNALIERTLVATKVLWVREN